MSAKYRSSAPPMVYVSYVGTAITGSVLVLSMTQLFMYEKSRWNATVRTSKGTVRAHVWDQFSDVWVFAFPWEGKGKD
jgi:hypothetical protein